ncbi:alanine/glycine:cation symporter family protein [Luteimonas deserti]|uniref:Alanine:cation symporter family protein n=1 Tax=Luteimonas deserti TaxID=2752306 RepID=A0A7Z0QSD9_9GAMM|nr:alanine/glycine:cation symporter family protein [Luteimonas deserti]NYZ62910.1 alanine:cation symporter family protein [Luteimonas deserti]
MDVVPLIESALAPVVDAINGVLWNYVLVGVLPLVGVWFSVRLGFIQFRRFPKMLSGLVRGTEGDHAGISPLQSLCTSLASRVGTGNLVGVAIALTVGGPGAIFWMWLVACFGMATAYVESALAQLYKRRDAAGHYRGGPAFYMAHGLRKPWLGAIFSVCLILAFGLVFSAVQANSISEAVTGAWGVAPGWTALVLVAVAAPVIFGGLRRVAAIAELVVPAMALAYLLLAAWVIVTNLGDVPAMLALIVRSALGLDQAAGGVLGGLAVALLNGVKRGLFSNEAGMGSAPNIAASATPSPHHPASQGLLQAFGVFVDTLVICTATALMILLSGALDTAGGDGAVLTQQAMAIHFGGWGPTFIAIALAFFATTSILGNYAYAESALVFLRGGRVAMLLLRLGCLGMVGWGAFARLDIVWDTADAAMGLMAIVNLLAIVLLSGVAVRLTRDYDRKIRAGETSPRLDAADFPELGDTIDRSIWTATRTVAPVTTPADTSRA